MNEKQMMEFLRDLLTLHDISQKEFSEATGISDVSISRWLSGKRIPKLNDLIKMYNTLGYKLDVIPNYEKPKRTIYIGGSITNNPDYLEQFMNAENRLSMKGYAVINPVKNEGFSYRSYIDMGLAELSKCEVLYLLRGWEQSAGARLEYSYAKTVGMEIWIEASRLDGGSCNEAD